MAGPSDRSADPGLFQAADGRYYLDESSSFRSDGVDIGLLAVEAPDVGLIRCEEALATSALGKPAAGDALRLWPNPVRDRLYFQWAGPRKAAAILIVDQQGRVIRMLPADRENRFGEGGALPAGPYWLVVLHPNGSSFLKR